MKSWKIWTAFIMVFVAGLILGAVGLGLTLQHKMRPRAHAEFHEEVRSHLLARIMDKVQPDASAIPAIKEALDLTINELEALRQETHPRLKATIQRGQARIRKLLTPEQAKRFDIMTEKLKQGRFGLFRLPLPPPPLL